MGKKRSGRVKKSGSTLFSIFEKLFLVSLSFLVFFLVSSRDDEKHAVLQNQVMPEIALKQFAKEDVALFFDNELDRQIIDMVEKARVKIVASTYTLSPCAVTDALKKAQARGVELKLISGKQKPQTLRELPFREVRIKNGIMHEKFLAVDSRDVLVSSRNMTGSGSLNSGILMKNVPLLATLLEQELDQLVSGDFSRSQCSRGCDFRLGKIYVTPGKACMAIKKELVKAQKEVKGAFYTMTPGTPMHTGLKKVLSKKISVEFIVDDWHVGEKKKVNSSLVYDLQTRGAKIIWDNIFSNGQNVVFHHKFAVVDKKTTLFGSMNWTKSGCYSNRELVLILHNTFISESLEGAFSRMYTTLKR